jgi:Tol biopolymer transport system component
MKFADGQWSPPNIAPFAMEYGDFEPSVTPDGTRVYFGSARPLPGQTELNMNPDIWYANRTDTIWEVPQRFAGGMFHLTFTSNQTMYYSYWASGEERGSIFRREVVGREYGPRQNMGELHEFFYGAHQPAVALDESYILFSSPPRTGSVGGLDIFVSFRAADGGWDEPINLGEGVNTPLNESAPAISPDGKYIFFTRSSGQQGDIYWVSADILDSLR